MPNLVLGQRLPTGKCWLPHKFDSWEDYKALFFRVVGYEIFTEEVLRFHKSDARVRIVTAAARGSKSYTAAHDAAPYAYATDPASDSMIVCVGYDYKTNKEFDYLFDIFVNRRQRLWQAGFRYELERAVNSPTGGDMEICLVKGSDEHGAKFRSRIVGLSSKNKESLQGWQASVALMSEAAEHESEIYEKYLKTRCWKLVAPTTPKQHAVWLKELSERGRQDPSLGIETFEFFPHTDANGRRVCANPTYDWDLFDQAQSEAAIRVKTTVGPDAKAEDDASFAEQFLGRWVFYTGRVLPFDRRRHMIPFDSFDPHGCTIAVSVDAGYKDPFSAGIWAIHPSGIFIRLDEVYERLLTTEQAVEKVRAKLRDMQLTADYCTGDPRAPQVSRIFHEAGLPVYALDKNAQSSREAGYRRYIDLLTQGPVSGFPGLYMTDRCVHAAEEAEKLCFKPGIRNEFSATSIVGADHTVDDTRYFLMTRPHAREKVPVVRDWIREARAAYSPSAMRRYWPEGVPELGSWR